jgi:hypothetical protein
MQSIKKVIAIGDSFLAGTELKKQDTTWPGLFAKQHALEYQCLARAGHTSQFVLRTLVDALSTEPDSCFFVIHWPSAMRFEYVDRDRDIWVQINPNAVLHGNRYSPDVQKLYYQHVNSLLGDKWHNLLMIYSAVQALKQTQHCYAMTTVDDFLFATDFHNPGYVEFLQQQCQDHVYWFDGMTFLQWSDHKQFVRGPGGHPLEQAHQCAFEYFNPVYTALISNNESLT